MLVPTNEYHRKDYRNNHINQSSMELDRWIDEGWMDGGRAEGRSAKQEQTEREGKHSSG